MAALNEALVCIQAAKLYGGGLPVLCTMTYDPNVRIMTGETLETVVAALEDAGVDALGCNCGVGPEQLVALLPRFLACAKRPLVMQPNAGLPVFLDGETRYPRRPGSVCRADAASRGGRRLGAWRLLRHHAGAHCARRRAVAQVNQFHLYDASNNSKQKHRPDLRSGAAHRQSSFNFAEGFLLCEKKPLARYFQQIQRINRRI